MNSMRNSWKYTILRAVLVAGSGMIFGYVLYDVRIITPTMKAFQFSLSGITIGVAYAALKGPGVRNGLAALLLWYIILIGLIEEYNSWLLILNLAYIGGMAGATFVHQRAVNTGYVHGIIQRIVLAGAMMAIANGLIVVFLACFSLKAAASHPTAFVTAATFNLQIGALIGLVTGIGMEMAEYLNGKLFRDESEIEEEHTE